MAVFDYEGARKTASDDQIARFLSSKVGFDYDGAINAGADPSDIIKNMFETGRVTPANTQEKPTGILGVLGSGIKQTAGSLRTAFNVATDDEADVLESSAKSQKIPTSEAQDAFRQSVAERKETGDDSFWQGVKNVIGAAIENPKGALHETVAQIPNSAAAMGTMGAGALAGSAFGPVGTIAGGIVGALFGNVALETGGIAQEQVAQGDYNRDEALKQGAIKGSVIGAVDAATMGATGLMFKPAFNTARKAGQAAITKALVDKGIDPLDNMAVKAAFETMPGLTDIGKKAAIEAMPKGIKGIGLHGAAMGLETAGEGIGEYAGSTAAGLDASFTDAAMESLMSMPQSGAQVAIGKGLAKGKGILESITPAPSIINAPTADAAISAFSSDMDGILSSIPSEESINATDLSMTMPFDVSERDLEEQSWEADILAQRRPAPAAEPVPDRVKTPLEINQQNINSELSDLDQAELEFKQAEDRLTALRESYQDPQARPIQRQRVPVNMEQAELEPIDPTVRPIERKRVPVDMTRGEDVDLGEQYPPVDATSENSLDTSKKPLDESKKPLDQSADQFTDAGKMAEPAPLSKGQPVTWQNKKGDELSGTLVSKKNRHWMIQKEDGKNTLVLEKDIKPVIKDSLTTKDVQPDQPVQSNEMVEGEAPVQVKQPSEMTLPEMENSGVEPWQVTRSRWTEVQREERRRLGQDEGGDNPRAPWVEYENYHEDSVKQALADGLPVPESVLKDYPDLAPTPNNSSQPDADKQSRKEIIFKEFGNFGYTFANAKIETAIDKLNSSKFRFNRYSESGKNAFKEAETQIDQLKKIKESGFDTLDEWAKSKAQQASGQMAPEASQPGAMAEEFAPMASARTLDETGRVSDGKGGMKPGDVFKTASGRTTTPYPKQKSDKYFVDWLVDNAIAEAKSRGDRFNQRSFENITRVDKGRGLTTADGEWINQYLFGKAEDQPNIVRPITKPLISSDLQNVEMVGSPDTVASGTSQPAPDILSKSGQPFASKGSAAMAISRSKSRSTHEPVQVDGGWVGREIDTLAEKQQPLESGVDLDGNEYTISKGYPRETIKDQKSKMVSAIESAIEKAPTDERSKTVVSFGEQRSENSKKIIDVKVNGRQSASDGYSIMFDSGGWSLVKGRGGLSVETIRGFTLLKDAKNFTEAYLKGETEPNGTVKFKGQGKDYEYSIPNSKYHLRNFLEKVSKSGGVNFQTLQSSPESGSIGTVQNGKGKAKIPTASKPLADGGDLIKTGKKVPKGYVFHNTTQEALDQIKQEGLSAGSFTLRPFDFVPGQGVYLAVKKSDLKNIEEHQYGKEWAIEPSYIRRDEYGQEVKGDDGYLIYDAIPTNKIYLVDKKGIVISRIDQLPNPSSTPVEGVQQSAADRLKALYQAKQKEKQDALHNNKQNQASSDTGSSTRQRLRRAITQVGDPDKAKITVPSNQKEKALHKLAKALGIKPVYFRTSDTATRVTGFYFPGTDEVFINLSSGSPINAVFGHELVHYIKDAHPDLYDYLVKEFEKNKKDYFLYVAKENVNREMAGLEKISEEKALEEFIADFANDSFQRPEFWDKLYKKSPSMFQNLVDSIKKIFGKIKSVLTRSEQYILDVDKAQDDLAKVVDEVMRRVKEVKTADTGKASFQSQKIADQFYSQMRNFLDAKLTSGPAQNIKAQIEAWAKKGEYKQEELEWSGLSDWLGNQEGKVTKQAVMDYLDQNRVVIEEVVKGGDDMGALVREKFDRDFDWDEWLYETKKEEAQIAWEDRTHIVWDSLDKGKNEYKDFEDFQEDVTFLKKEFVFNRVDIEKYIDEAMDANDGMVSDISEEIENDFDAAMIRARMQSNGIDYGDIKKYKSSHFDEPNILAHIRMNERTGPNGEKVLFIEEVQSDYAQDKRKGKDVPNAPFINKTGSWAMLAFKKMVRYASENNFDQIAWTDGATQAERYDLSKQVEKIRWDTDAGEKSAFYVKKGQAYETMIGTLDQDNNVTVGPYKGRNIIDIVGKDIGEKIIKESSGSLSGLDLKIGGSGMEGFYDRILPAEVNKFFGKKSWGSPKVEKTDMGWSIPVTPEMRDKALYEGMPMFQSGRDGDGAAMSIEAKNTASKWKKVKAGDMVSGLTVRSGIPNMDSIDATLDDYTSLGLREVPMDIFELEPGQKKLAEAIEESGEITPLIVVVDGHEDGMAYILEGSHRIDALATLGVKSFPALVIYDESAAAKDNPDIRYQVSADPTEDTLALPNQSTLKDDFIYNVIDQLAPIDKAYAQIKKEITEDKDFGGKERLRINKTNKNIDLADEEFYSPMTKIIGESGHTVADVDEFLYSRHAKEANARLRLTNAKFYLKKLADAQVGEKLKKKIDELDQIFDLMEFPTKEAQESYFKILEEEISKADEHLELAENNLSEFKSTLDDNPAATELEKLQRLKKRVEKGKQEVALKKRWDAFKAKPSGMTDADAEKLQKKWEGNKAMQEIAKIFDAMTADKLRRSYESGRMSKETYEAVKGTFDYYAPLYREERLPRKGIGSGLKNLGSDVQARGGSTKPAIHILANAIIDHKLMLIKEGKAEVSRSFLEFVKENHNPDFLDFEPMKTKATYDADGNIMMVNDQSYDPEIETKVKVDGKVFIIRANPNNIHAKRIIGIINGANDNSGPIVNFLGNFNRMLAMAHTTMNPEFMLSNFPRDIQTALFNLSNQNIKDIRKKVVKGIPAAMKGLHSLWRGDKSHPMAAWADRFERAGGKVGWIDYDSDIKSKIRNLESEADLFRKGNLSKKAFRKFFTAVDDYNSIVENAVRLSTFKQLVEAGMSEPKAAIAVRRLTVDFNQRGAFGHVINSAYIFANAGIQGNAQLIKTLINSKTARKALVGVAGSAFAMAIANSTMGGDDDDGVPYYDGIDHYIKSRNIIIMNPFSKTGKYFKIPNAWGLNVVWSLGTELGDMITQKNYKPLDGASRLLQTAMDAFNPVQSATLAQSLAPTMLDPFIQSAENKSGVGSPIMPEVNSFDKTPPPDSERYWSSVRPISKWLAQGANKITGGNTIRPGAVDVSPETMDLIFDSFTGGVGRFIGDMFALPGNVISGEQKLTKAPFVRRLYGEPSEYKSSGDYRENITEIYRLREELKAYPEDRARIVKEKAFGLYSVAKATEKRLSNLNKMMKAAKNEETKKRLKEKMEAEKKKFNALFDKRTAA